MLPPGFRQGRNDGGRWDRAFARFAAAEAEVRRIERATAGASAAAEAALEGAYDAALDAMCAALRRLLRAPAPDLGALAAKLDLVVRHDVGTLAGGAACLAAVRGDALRLSPSTTLRTGSGQARRLAGAAAAR